MRPRLHLDFVRPHARRPRLAAFLLAVGLAGAAGAGAEYARLAAQAERLEAAIADTARMARRDLPRLRAAADPKQLAEEVRGANLVLAELTVPWDELFREIEAAGGEGIALLAIQPDAASGTVRLAGEARRYEDALAYVGRLERGSVLNRVFLASHELRPGAAPRPVAFAILAQWREAGGARIARAPGDGAQ
jgi:hypothetical protein